jgi:predicted DsbA family dithiol-disulfide isomerase
MKIDIFSDPVCPWCYIGKRRLARALESRPSYRPALRWRAYQLNPTMPEEGMERQLYLAMKFGSPEQARRIYDQISQVGTTEGIDFRFDRIAVTPNTIDAHRMIRFADRIGRAMAVDAMVGALFRAYFLEGRDIGDPEVLATLAGETGLDPIAARAHLAGDADLAEVLEEDMHARRVGIEGVPCFIVNGRYALSGAQEPEAFFALFDMALQEDREAAETEA